MPHSMRAVLASALIVAASSVVDGQTENDRVTLAVAAGRRLRIRLNERITISYVGQVVTAIALRAKKR